MRLIKAIILLAGAAAHAAPALQETLASLGPCDTVPTRAHSIDHPTSTNSEEDPLCEIPSLVAVTFNERAVTFYGESIYLVGNNSLIGDWDPSDAVLLDAANYTEENPVWSGTAYFTANTSFEYKYIRKEPDGSIFWESDPNRLYMVEGNCEGRATQNDTWR